jgi:N6-L-threonylcarbamoyladenine synthase
MLILGIETSCDETACAVVRDGKEILSNIVVSQTDLHVQYGGVFPELACRRHIDVMLPVIEQALQQAGVTSDEIDRVAAAHGPGLIGALLIGLNTAKALALGWNKPFVGVNHVEAHLYAAMMGKEKIDFPALGVVVSGGHTFLIKIEGIGSYTLIGTTVDDAIGEAFDKVAALLDLPYPGGPQIEKLAREGDPTRYPFKPGRVKERPWDFSFSGLKTNVLYTVKGDNSNKKAPTTIAERDKADVAASFQEVALNDIVDKSLRAFSHFGCKEIFLGGGVSCSGRLRALFAEKGPAIPISWPALGLSQDNGAMIAALAYHLPPSPLSLEPFPRWNFLKKI